MSRRLRRRAACEPPVILNPGASFMDLWRGTLRPTSDLFSVSPEG